jgi:hypothetical protein
VGIYGVWRWRDMKEILLGTARESCMIMMIIAMAFLFTYVMSYLHITQSMAQWLVGLGLSKWAYLFWVNILLLVLGCFLPPVAIILMVTPVIMPGILAAGFDPIWFGIVLTINMEMGLITPPVGLNLFVINGIAPDITFRQIMRGVMPFIWIMGFYIVLLAIFPEIVMWLPENRNERQPLSPCSPPAFPQNPDAPCLILPDGRRVSYGDAGKSSRAHTAQPARRSRPEDPATASPPRWRSRPRRWYCTSAACAPAASSCR